MVPVRNRPWSALAYAHAALRDFQTYGAGAADHIEKTRRLIAELEQAG